MEKIKPKNWEKKNCQNSFQAILRFKQKTSQKKWHGQLSLKGGGDLSGPTTKKTFFYVCLPYHKPANIKDKNSFYICF